MALKIIKKILFEIGLVLPIKYNREDTEKVYDFFCNYPDFRSLDACSKVTGLSIYKCAYIKQYLYKKRKLGLYYFAPDVGPQAFMQDYIVKKYPELNKNSYILEIGPGNFPLFYYRDYKNWYAVDRNFTGTSIMFKDQLWAQNMYPKDRIFKGNFEELTKIFGESHLQGVFDLVCASHAYEHTFRPIESLIQMREMLKSGGKMVLFVPDLYTDDPSTKDLTHTIYVSKEMMQEFFHYAGGFKDIEISTFRPNADLVVSAVKI